MCSGSANQFGGTTGSNPVVTSTGQTVMLFLLAVFIAAFPGNDSLIAAVLSAKEVSLMVVGEMVSIATPVAQCVSAVLCSCVAAGAVPRVI